MAAALCALAVALVLGGCAGAGEGDARRGAPPGTAASARAGPPVLCDALRVHDVGRVRVAAATELSGLVLSRSQRGVLWAHNDSGDVPRVFALSPGGRLLAEVALSGAQAFDWEDIAAGPKALYVGDIGDNLPQRDVIVVYRIAEPRVGGRGAVAKLTAAATPIRLRYPDGRHDAEALLRDPVSGALIVVTKSFSGRAGVYVAGRPVAGATALTTLRRRATLDLGTGGIGDAVTAGDVSADGRTIVVRTYSSAFAWTRRPGESVAAALRRRPCTAGAGLLAEGQGESLALSDDGRAFYTVPEGARPEIRRYAPD